jgi:hypothetical protein
MKKIRMQGKQAGGGNSRQLEFKTFKIFFKILSKSYASRGAAWDQSCPNKGI